MMNIYKVNLGEPARSWEDGYPIGNGRLGAMVMGKIDEETITINEESVWYGFDRDRKNPDTLKYLNEIRSLLLSGEIQKAHFLAKMAMTSTSKYMNPYQPAGDMRICFLKHKYPVTDYRRTLDLNDALCRVQYQMKNVHYTREHFVSHAYQTIAMKLTAEPVDGANDGKLTFCVNINRRPFEERTEKLDDCTVCNYGRLGENGIGYFTAVRVISKGGKVHTIGDWACVEDAQEAYIYLVCGTDFQDPEYRKHCLERLDAAMQIGYEEIRRRHLEEYHSLFNRMELHFGEKSCVQNAAVFKEKNPYADRNMNELLAELSDESSVYLAEILFHYARYLMISSSYDCELPANLQGIWNGEYVPAWQCNYTININTEMNYWMVEKCNLSECHQPLFKLIRRMAEKGKETAKKLYGCDGFCAHHATNIWAFTEPEGILDGAVVWPMGGAWLVLHLYEHYAYTRDVEFLEKEAMPIMREAIRFFEKYLTLTEGGYLVTGPTISPENTYDSKTDGNGNICMGTSMDVQILWQLFTTYLKGCEVLQSKGIVGTAAKQLISDSVKVQQMLEKLPPVPLTIDGRVQEWLGEYEETLPGHRHISHLFGLHPGTMITESEPEYFAAARKTLEHRLANGSGYTGWSSAWIACCWAKLKDGEQAWASIHKMLESCIKINLLDTCPPFQIDGNFGLAECILDILVQEHTDCVEFLPALPETLTKSGYVKGLVLLGGILADFAWYDGKICELELTANQGPLEIVAYINGSKRNLSLHKGVNTIQC